MEGDVEPGQVWWCDGVALSFEPHFKRRPVLIVAVPDEETVLAIPLSSHRRIGQEQAVTHQGGVSFFAGAPREVPLGALRKPLGVWDGFAAWRDPPPPAPPLWRRIFRFFASLFSTSM